MSWTLRDYSRPYKAFTEQGLAVFSLQRHLFYRAQGFYKAMASFVPAFWAVCRINAYFFEAARNLSRLKLAANRSHFPCLGQFQNFHTHQICEFKACLSVRKTGRVEHISSGKSHGPDQHDHSFQFKILLSCGGSTSISASLKIILSTWEFSKAAAFRLHERALNGLFLEVEDGQLVLSTPAVCFRAAWCSCTFRFLGREHA